VEGDVNLSGKLRLGGDAIAEKVLKTDANGNPIWGNDENTTYSAGTGLSLSGTTFSLPNTVTAGTYRSITVSAQGIVTSGTNPTTISGYGITDALPLTGGTLTGILVGRASSGVIAGSGQGTPSFEVYGENTVPSPIANNAAYMTFHRPGAYAVRFGLDNDNVMKVGGWSLGAVSHRVILGDGFINSSGLRVTDVLDVRSTIANSGWVGLTPGNATQTGYISWHKTDGLRQAYMGWNNTNLTLVLENSSNYSITGGNVTIGSNLTVNGTYNIKMCIRCARRRNNSAVSGSESPWQCSTYGSGASGWVMRTSGSSWEDPCQVWIGPSSDTPAAGFY
jgi:hypothetical protein